MADAYARPEVGERQAEYVVLAALLRARAAGRDGDARRARGECVDALERADRLGHVWLRLLALEALDRLDPDGEHRVTLLRLVGDVAEGLASTRTRARIRLRWLRRD